MNIAIEGDNKSTRLYIDGKQVEELNIQERWMDKEGKTRIRNVRTLVFPLEKAGNFKSKVSNLKVWQQ
jgi:hexosaminidase